MLEGGLGEGDQIFVPPTQRKAELGGVGLVARDFRGYVLLIHSSWSSDLCEAKAKAAFYGGM